MNLLSDLNSTDSLKNKITAVAYITLCLLVPIYMNGLISTYPITSDAHQNLRMSYNLYKNGVISNDAVNGPVLSPTSYREPVPIIVNAIHMYLHPAINKKVSLTSLADGLHTKDIKQVNLLWVFLLLLGTGILIFIITRNRWVPFVALVFVFVYFIRFGNHFNALTTELPAAVCIIWTTIFLTLSVKEQKIGFYVLSGLTMSLLILTKAVFFHISVLVLLFLIFFNQTDKKSLKISSFVIGLMVLTTPWLIRNYIIYNDFEITQRSGVVLHQRAVLNQMTPDELIGATFIWGPQIYKDTFQGTRLGADPTDFQTNGKYVRVNRDYPNDSTAIISGRPKLAVSYFAKSRAEINKLQNEMGYDESEASRREVYTVMGSEAKKMLLKQPVKHLLLSVVFLWRGIWCFPDATIPIVSASVQSYIHNILNLLSYLSLMGIFFMSVIKRKTQFIALTILPAAMIFLQAFATVNLTRMTEPAIPSMLASFTFIIWYLYRKYWLHSFK